MLIAFRNSLKNPYFLFFILILITRLVYTGVGVLVRNLYLDTADFPSWTYNSPHQILNVWTVWDSGFYYEIAVKGYLNNLYIIPSTTDITKFEAHRILDYTKVATPYPFLPLYPYLVKLLAYVFQDVVVGGLILSNLSLFLSAILLYKLLLSDYDYSTALWAVLGYIFYPLNFILSSFFTESLYNVLLFLILLLLKKHKFVFAFIAGAFLGVTRVVGSLIALPIFYFVYAAKGLSVKKLVLIGFVPSLFLIHIYSLYLLTGDWFVLFISQYGFGRLHDSFFVNLTNYFKGHALYALFDVAFIVFAAATVYIGLFILRPIVRQRVDTTYVIITVYSFVVPLLSGTSVSFPRYTLGIFPVFMGIAWIMLKFRLKTRLLLLFLSFGLSILLFTAWTLSSQLVI